MTVATASIASYRTKKGLRYAVRYRDAQHKQRHETVPGYGRQAKEIATERAREIELGRHYVAPPQTLGAFLAEWLERHRNHVKDSTWKRRQDALRSLGVLSEREDKGELGRNSVASAVTGRPTCRSPLSERPLDRLQVADVEDALAVLARRAPRQAQIAGATLRTALKDAERRGQRIDKGLLEIKTNRYRSRDPRFLTWPDEVQRLQSWMPEYVCRIVPIAVLTGARQGELFDLLESDLDLDKAVMRIRVGKTQAATRSVNLPATAVQLFKEQLLARTHTESGHVFPAPMGGRWTKDRFMERVFRPARKRAGMDDVVFHSLRHTAISLMASAGIPVEVVAAQVGHKDGGVLILRRYRHLFAHETAAAADKLDALVRGTESKPDRLKEHVDG